MNSSSFSTVNPATGEQIETSPFLLPGKQKLCSRAPKKASDRIESSPCINVHNSSRTLQRYYARTSARRPQTQSHKGTRTRTPAYGTAWGTATIRRSKGFR
jgi:hypothetical protein